MAKRNEIVKAGSKALAQMEPWEAEVLAEAKTDAAKYASGTPRIQHRGGVLQIDGQKVKDNRLTLAVIAEVKAKAYYEGDYVDGVAQTPVCYAFHPTDESQMVPHDAAPNKQSERCVGCPHNRFGTAERGRGKRCKDEVRLMTVVPSQDGSMEAEVRMITVPPGSLKGFGEYITKLRDMGATIRSVLTEIGVEAFKGAYKLTFHPQGKLTGDQYLALKERRESAVEQAMKPYPVLESEEERPARGKKSSRKLD